MKKKGISTANAAAAMASNGVHLKLMGRCVVVPGECERFPGPDFVLAPSFGLSDLMQI